MYLDVQYYPVQGLNGRMVCISEVASGSLQNKLEPEELEEKARSNLKAGPDIIIMEGSRATPPSSLDYPLVFSTFVPFFSRLRKMFGVTRAT
jgi:hypothetical protein